MTDASTPQDSAPGSDSIDFMTPALGYARTGWRVLRCHPGEKRPAMRDWPTEATTDVDRVRDWWVQHPTCNIGIATGAGSGFFVLDIDPKNGGDEALDALQSQHGGLPRTYTVRTGSGGTHYYFRHPEDFEVTNSPGDLKGTGIDVRGEGGQVLAPPSVTALGEYRVILSAPIVAAPAWLLDMLRPKLRVVEGGASPARVEASDFTRQRDYAVNVALPAAARAVAAAPEGSRNQTLNDNVLALAGIAAHDRELLPHLVAWQMMNEACKSNGLLDADGIDSFSATFRSAWSAGLEKPRLDWPPRDRGAGLAFGAAAGTPVVSVSGRREHEGVDEVLGHFADANGGRPRVFLHGTEAVEVVGQPAVTVELDRPRWRYLLSEVMEYEKDMPKGGTARATLPDKWLDMIHSHRAKPLPGLDRISFTPYFAPSGRYVEEPEYDTESRTYLSPALGLDVFPIAEKPTQSEVDFARSVILDDLLGDFAFVSEADRAHAVALMLLPFVRDMIDGATPLHNIEAPTPGSGKGLLMKVLLLPALGGRQVIFGQPPTEEEWGKAIFSHLRATPQALVIDNVNHKVTSGTLCMALTEPVITTRKMGGNEQLRVPVRAAWVMTANNPKFSDEVARRTVRIRVDAGVEHPEDRTGFRHSDLLGWAAAHRAELIRACCTLVQSWIVAGAPTEAASRPFGSFEQWQATMSGLLGFVGVSGLLENKAEFQATSDDESNAWDQLVDLLLLSVEREWSAAALAEIVHDQGIGIELGAGSRALMMGRELSRQRGRWHRGHTFTSGLKKGRTMWRLSKRTAPVDNVIPDL